MVRSALKKALGLLPQEYVCVGLEDISDPPSVYMTTEDSPAYTEVTDRHVFLGYKPLVIGVKFDGAKNVLHGSQRICLSFTHHEFKPELQWRGFATSGKCIARLVLTRAADDLNLSGIAFFVGDHGEHSFLPPLQAVANKLVDALRRKPMSEANLSGNQYDQVRIAYCFPRVISVITVREGDLMNFFPTDLHGNVGDGYYLSSLRIGGMACGQVERLRRIIISRVDVSSFRKAYQMGKNHMNPLQPADQFEPAVAFSASGLPVYPNAVSYLELERVRHWDVGIHRIFAYKVVEEGKVKTGKTLAHIHRYYAQWRLNHHLSAEYFFR